MSWQYTASHLLNILERWKQLSADTRFLYMLYLQEKVVGLTEFYCRKGTLEDDQKGRDAHLEAVEDISRFGVSVSAFSEFRCMPSEEDDPEIWKRYRAVLKKVERRLLQVYNDGNPYSPPPKELK